MTIHVIAQSKTFTKTDDITGQFESNNPDGLPPPAVTPFNWYLAYSIRIASERASPQSTFYVSTTGSDSNPGTESQPFLTIGRGVTAMAGGDQLVIEDGEYVGPSNFISSYRYNVPSGSAGQLTLIRARNPFRVKIRQIANSNIYYDAPISLQSHVHHVRIDGIFAIKDYQPPSAGTDNTSVQALMSGTYLTLSRCLFWARAAYRYSGAIQYCGAVESYNVVEDCHALGSYRYCIAGGTGGPSVAAGKAVVRRCTVSMQWAGPVQDPSAPFNWYGSNDGAFHDVKDVQFANCFALYSRNVYANDDNNVWGGFYHPKCVANVRHYGCGVINSGGTWGAFASDSFGEVDSCYYDSCMIANHTLGDGDNGSPRLPWGFFKNTGQAGTIHVDGCVGRGLTSGNWTTAFGWTGTGNDFSGTTPTPIMRNGSYMQRAIYATGRLGTRWGETGFDELTDMPMFPFPFEDEIKTQLYGMPTINRGTYDLPTTVPQSVNILAGTSLAGVPKTLTSYILECFGNQVPLSEVYA